MPGLNSILNCLSSIEVVEKNLNDGVYTRKSIEENQEKIVEMNVSQLYDFGVNSLGVSINTYAPYAPYTIRVKQEKGQPYDRVTLRDTGAFHSSFELEFDPVGFYISATDSKTQALIDKYGVDIFGLTPENKNILIFEYVEPNVLEQIRNEIFK